MSPPSVRGPLHGTTVLVAGAGFAGLAAARDLERGGATVTVVEARQRVGGRVWTIRDGFAKHQHAEGGADLIEANQTALLGVVKDLGLETAPILRGGFMYYGANQRGRLAIQTQESTFRRIAPMMAELIRDYQASERRWDSGIAARYARESVMGWLDRMSAPKYLRQRVGALRGLFLADPEDLSLLALIDFFAADGSGPEGLSRVVGGNDRIASEMARHLETPPRFDVVLRRIRQARNGVTVTLDTPAGRIEQRVNYVVSAMPASTLRDVEISPALPELQRRAIATLRYGPATRVLLQFERRFWHKPGRPRAFGSDQSTGAVWDGNEQQRGPAGILSLLAGGSASAALQRIMAREHAAGVAERLRWLGRPAPLIGSASVSWEHDPWARGGYAYFDPSFDPLCRDALARPAGRVMFAGEHTSQRWQGYMNGAVESGQRAAAEVAAHATTPGLARSSLL